MTETVQRLAGDFGVGVNVLGAVVLVCRILVKALPNPRRAGWYLNLIKGLRHAGLSLGDLEERI